MKENLFDNNKTSALEPLASRMRPKTLDEFVTSVKELKKDSYLYRCIKEDMLTSLIVYGPPGCGKTTLANIISCYSASRFISLNAAVITLVNVKTKLEEAQRILSLYSKRTILFIDEVHRLNRLSQDVLLPYVESGIVVLIGATTENPYFTLSNALISRSRILELKPLRDDDILLILKRAIEDKERGYGNYNIIIDEKSLSLIANSSQGDARIALNLLENCVTININPSSSEVIVERQIVEKYISKRTLLYDKNADYHYDNISAFIKSVRGSDPDAALLYMFVMLERGEDPLFIFRRMLILAAEDIGLADPNAITVVNSCKEAFESVGMPEGEYHLSMAALYLSLTHKSSSVSCFHEAKRMAQSANFSVPLHLRNKNPGAKNYKYPHAFPNHYVEQQYLPDSIKGAKFYEPGELGFEKKLKEIYNWRKGMNNNEKT